MTRLGWALLASVLLNCALIGLAAGLALGGGGPIRAQTPPPVEQSAGPRLSDAARPRPLRDRMRARRAGRAVDADWVVMRGLAARPGEGRRGRREARAFLREVVADAEPFREQRQAAALELAAALRRSESGPEDWLKALDRWREADRAVREASLQAALDRAERRGEGLDAAARARMADALERQYGANGADARPRR